MDSCKHDQTEQRAIFDKKIKVIHEITNKLSIYIKATSKEITHDNFKTILIITMRELNKHKLHGETKKELCTQIITLLLDSFGLPHIISYYTGEIIGIAIEEIYLYGFHRFKRVNRCVMT